jgi:hypothetical protein
MEVQFTPELEAKLAEKAKKRSSSQPSNAATKPSIAAII